MQASNTPIDKYHMKMLELLLSDPEIAKEMKVDGKHISNFTLRDDGTALFGVFKWGWVNRLFNTYYQIDFFGIVQRIASVLTRNDKSGSDLMEFIREAIDKIINKDEKEKVIELLLQYAMLLSENSVLKLRYNAQQDEPGLANNSGKLRRAHGMGRASLNLGGESIPLKLEVTIDQYRLGRTKKQKIHNTK